MSNRRFIADKWLTAIVYFLLSVAYSIFPMRFRRGKIHDADTDSGITHRRLLKRILTILRLTLLVYLQHKVKQKYQMMQRSQKLRVSWLRFELGRLP